MILQNLRCVGVVLTVLVAASFALEMSLCFTCVSRNLFTLRVSPPAHCLPTRTRQARTLSRTHEANTVYLKQTSAIGKQPWFPWDDVSIMAEKEIVNSQGVFPNVWKQTSEIIWLSKVTMETSLGAARGLAGMFKKTISRQRFSNLLLCST